MNQEMLNQAQIATLARAKEDVVAADRLIVRHKASTRLTHWLAAIFFFLAMLTGFAIFTPYLSGLSGIFGGGATTRSLHPWFSLVFSVCVLLLFLAWRGRMKLEPGDEAWRKNVGGYLRYEVELPETGKFNAGQKMFFYAVVLGAIALLVSGIVMWIPTSFPYFIRAIAYWLHEIAFIAFVIGIVYHIYMSSAAMPGTFRAMTRGTVTKDWAERHHGRWCREVIESKK
jgi:formate dehydrogenase subunit gamma